jgi:hypothetical protein
MIDKQNIKHVMISQKPRPDGLASALRNPRPGQSRQKANKLARPGLAYIGLGLAGLTASGRAGTSLSTFQDEFVPCFPDRDVPARLGLEAPALAWPEGALAFSNARPGQSH